MTLRSSAEKNRINQNDIYIYMIRHGLSVISIDGSGQAGVLESVLEPYPFNKDKESANVV